MFIQGPKVGGEVHRDPRVALHPSLDRGVFVGEIVVDHDVQCKLEPGVGLGDEFEEVQELPAGMPLVAGVGHLPVRTSRAANRLVVPWRR